MATRYTPEQMGALRRKANEVAEETLARHGIEDPEGKRHAKLVRFFFEEIDEWAAILGFR